MIFCIVFLLILLLFFACAQFDVTALLWSAIMGHPVSPWPWLSALFLTALLAGILICALRWLKFRSKSTYVAYVFMTWFATELVSVPFVSWWWHLMLGIVAVGLIVCEKWWTTRFNQRCPAPRNLWQSFMPPVVRLTVLCLFMGIGAGAADVDHYELRTAQALMSKHPEQAYQVGEHALDSSSRLFALRCYLMATTQKYGLGEKVFEQPIPRGGCANLFLKNDARQNLIFPCEKLSQLLGNERQAGETDLAYLQRCAYDAYKREAPHQKEKFVPAIDYYLSALLLERQLDKFAIEIKHFYPRRVEQGKLPLYFAQALIFYARQRTSPAISYHDTAIEANYHDYSDMSDTITHQRVRYNLLRNAYGETYWWWYEYSR